MASPQPVSSPSWILSFEVKAIKTVISGVSIFWCSSFILPKSCINKINSLCGQFLWNGNIEGHHTARVSWETVTLTKDQGGLGIKDLHKWNLACILKLVWIIFFRPNSVWVYWFKEVILKGDVSNYWTISTSTRHSWLVNKMIKARELIYPLLKRRIGNGRSTRFWFDNWTPLGKLYTALDAGTSRLGIPKMATNLDFRIIIRVSFLLGVIPVFIAWIYSEFLEYKRSSLHSKVLFELDCSKAILCSAKDTSTS
ncbi:hypothetical protein DY000_02004891 [Brassica cretica]|uniref:Reverse transcriptase zinc-binding domain-containing protein n=1 Tax=Brassica cretica TaxID=69181 RepID=A0ABQ7C426_BRACR|nr:hypothetical protein DY000_02004891 [Brassica cretica]